MTNRLLLAAGLLLALAAPAAAQAPAISSAKAWESRSVEVFRGTSKAPSTSPQVRAGGYTAVIEAAPLLVAADRFNAGGGVVRNAAIPALLAGELDVAGNAETQALRLSIRRPDLRIILTATEGYYRIVGRRSRGISGAADLRGKRVGVIKDSSSDFFLHKMLESAGVRDEEVTIVPIFPLERMTEALSKGEVDAVTVWEPQIEVARRALGADAIELEGPSVYRELYNLNTTAAILADPQMRSQIVAYVRDIIAASAQMRGDPATARRLSAVASGHGQDLTDAAWKHLAFPGTLAPDLLDVMVEEEAWLARREGRPARARAELAGLIDATVLRDALAAEPAPH
jgi:sulfonate transport system substrate-binding protein